MRSDEKADGAKNARDALIRFLTGDEAELPAGAMSRLLEQFPAELKSVSRSLLGDGEAQTLRPECAAVRDLLNRYVSRAASAAAEMPEVARHLASCEHCRLELAQLAAIVEEQRDEWLALSRSLEEKDEQPFIALVGTAWHWAARTGRQIREALSRAEIDGRLMVSGWRLEPLPAVTRWGATDRPLASNETIVPSASERLPVTFRTGDSHPRQADRQPMAPEPVQPIALRLDLPEVAAVLVVVEPTHSASEHHDYWQITVRMEPTAGSPVDLLQVRVQKTGAPTLTSRAVTSSREAQFRVEPTSDVPYSLCAAWRSPGGEWHEEAFEIPVLAAARGRT
jgi:hypothetical protein